MDYKETRAAILRDIDLLAEFQKYGGRLGPPTNNDWQSVHSIDREDNNPSAAINVGNDPNKRGIYVDHAPTETGARSFFDMLAGMTGSPFMNGKEPFRLYGKQTGHLTGSSKGTEYKPPPAMADIEKYQKNLTPEIIQYMKDKRGLTEDSLAKYRIGWDLKKERNTFPVFDETGALVNVRYHNSKKKPKTLNWPGCGGAKLWGLDRMAKAAPGITIVACEGEFDAQLVEQETGLLAVSSTNGVAAFKKEWVTNHFTGFHVVLLYDADQEGREGVQRILQDFRPAVETGQVLSVKVIWLYEKIDKEHKDFTDWIVKDGGSGARLKEIIAQTQPTIFITPSKDLGKPIPLSSFEQIDKKKYAGKRVVLPLQVFGENTVAYHAVSKVTVSNCQPLKDGKCNGRKGHEGACLNEIEIPVGERVLIASVRATEAQLQKHLQDYVCDQNKRPALTYKDEDRLTIREVYAHQVVGAMAAERIELVEKPIYIIGGDLVEIGKYEVVGRVTTSFRDQQPTLLVDTCKRLEEDYQGFDVEKMRPFLEKLRDLDPHDIVEDIARNITQIYERDDIHMGNLLVLISPLEIDFPGEGRIRGRLSAINVGDTGTGKTTVVQKLCDAAQVGLQVSGMTASRTGITYGCEHDERRGWRIKAGAFLKMNRQILVVDEAQDLKSEDLKTMAEGLDTGYTRIDRIQNKVFESKTRVIFNCNPRHARRLWEQRTMDSYLYGCQAIQGIFAQMMIRRIDIVMYSTAWDVDKEKIFFPDKPDAAPLVTPEDLQALVFYAWNLKPEQIIIDDKVAIYIRQMAKHMSDKYGGADDLPIVYAEDFRKTMARLSVAYAILDLATTDDFDQVRVGIGHVSEAYELLDRIYGSENCNLERYAKSYLAAHGLHDLEEIRAYFDAVLAGPYEPKRRFHHIVYQLRHSGEDDRFRNVDIANEFEVSRQTIQKDMQAFIRHHLIDPKMQNGYKPQPKFNRLMSHLQRLDPEKYNFDRHYQEVYPDLG
jgi:hypothetical protein